MKRFSEQLHKKSQTVKLKKSEQADLRERLVSYMEYHPLPASMKAASISNTKKINRTAVITESFAQYAIPYQSFFKFGSVAAVFVLLVVPFMAERTVPGDSLYAVKVQFNEEVRSTLTWGSYEKVEWETERLNRRIAEARLLADEGLLTPEAEASVAAAVQEHSDNAKREIEVLRASDADEATIATIAFDSSLEVQAQALQNRPAIGGGEAAISAMTVRSPISDVIDKSLEKPAAAEEVEAPAFDKLMTRIELNTTRVRELRDSLVGVVTDKELADVSRRIDDIDRTIASAAEMSANPDTELGAREDLVDVLTRTQKLIVFMTELEVRETMEIESVVPVVPTSDEISIDRSVRQAKLAEAIAQLSKAVESEENEGVVEKIVQILPQLEIEYEEIKAAESYKEFLVRSDAALLLAADILSLVDTTDQALEVEPPVVAVSTSTATSTEETAEETGSSDEEVASEESGTESSVEIEQKTATTTDSAQEEIDTE